MSFLRALRAPFLAGSIVPVLIGAGWVFSIQNFAVVPLLITILGVACLHLGANLMNDYYDAKGSDPVNLKVTPFSGGSRVIQEKKLKPLTVLGMSLFFLCIGVVSGLWLVLHDRPLVLLLGGAGLAAGWLYSAPPFQLMSKGWGELLIFFAFGPLVTLGTAYVLTGNLSLEAFMIGFPQGFLILEVIWINEFPDYEADKSSGKRNLVVRMGLRRARYVYCIIMLLSYASIIFLVGYLSFTYLIMFCFISMALAIRAIAIVWKKYDDYEGLIPAQALTIQTLILQGLLVSAGLVLSRWIGK